MAAERVSHVTVSGFKSLHEVDLDLEPFTVLIDANGSGKSNFIDFFQLLAWAFSVTQGNLQSFIARRGRAKSLLYYGPQVTSHLDAELVFSGDPERSRYGFSKVLALADGGTDRWDRNTAQVVRNTLRGIRAYHFYDTSEVADIRVTRNYSGGRGDGEGMALEGRAKSDNDSESAVSR